MVKYFCEYMSKDCEYTLVNTSSPSSEESNAGLEMAREPTTTRKWEIFSGRNHFYCNGRLMTAPHSGVFILTVFLITITSTLFFIFDCQYLAQNVTVAIPIIGGVLFLFTMSSLLRTSLTDPGIIPRATADEAAYVEKQIEVTNSANSPTYRPPPRTKEVLVKGQTVKLKYCFTCKIFRPPRASHCSLCDNCVDRFDHHCPWVGNCVGRRNYRFFYMFIVSLAFLAVFIFACAIAHLILITREDRQFLDAVKDSPASLIVAIICFFSVWSILGLAGFHTYLIATNQTTNEDIKGSFTSKRGQENFNPYSQGNVCLNCFYILCGSITPSLIDRRGVVTEDYKNDYQRQQQHHITIETQLPLGTYTSVLQNGQHLPGELTGKYRQTAENNESNAGSVTHLVSNEQPLAVATPAITKVNEIQYTSQPCLNQVPVYSNIMTHIQPQLPLSKSQNFVHSLEASQAIGTITSTPKRRGEKEEMLAKSSVDDLHLDPVVMRDNHVITSSNAVMDKRKTLDNDLTLQDKENILLSASRLRLLQDTTMIESALDLDSLDDASIGNNSQAGLMKV